MITDRVPRAGPLRYAVVALVALLGCGEPFKPPEVCVTDCPLPPTKPPKVTFLIPTAGGNVWADSTIYVSATDDRQVTGVELYYNWNKLHPGTIAAPPYRMILGKYYHNWPACPGSIFLEAVAHDIEGNADTVQIYANFVPAPGGPPCG